jgi:Rad3-related DNA helicase
MLDKLIEILDSTIANLAENIDFFDAERFNAYQRDIIIKAFEAYANNKHAILIAPTGSGKSIIALLYSHCISIYNESSSAILASDTFLQKQYVDSHQKFTKHLSSMKFSMIKGKSNYTCNQNMQPYTDGICAIRKISPVRAYNEMPCAENCEYVKEYNYALMSTTKVLNYHVFLSYANYVGGHELIAAQSFVFDECHKIDDILDSFANTSISINIFKTIEIFIEHLSYLSIKDYDTTKIAYNEMLSLFKSFVKSVLQGDTYTSIHTKYISMLKFTLDFFKNSQYFDALYASSLEQSKSIGPNSMPASIQVVFDVYDLLAKFEFLLYDALHINGDKFVASYNAESAKITLSNIDTSSRFKSLILNHIDVPILFMSATVGNAEYFAKHLGIHNCEIIHVDSIFDFSRSPIVAVQPLLSMSQANKTQNMPLLINYIDTILDAHSTHNGIIHTSNKALASFIKSNSKHSNRMLTYSNRHEKQEILNLLKSDTNYVILAFSMEEGVDLYDDLARFQIIAKLSWQYLGDLIVKRKMEVYPEWYTMTTLNATLQTIGRPIRNANDYAITYVTDTSFVKVVDAMDLHTKARFKDEYYNGITTEFVNNTFNLNEYEQK